ncbi:aminopeptidase P family protein [uncultured Sulfitobacter sp.]|uniref:aminopeptidase P family protein n=1 Tax=uncultured Sulfitobacter sp. TaxID=191468 RepID=UPI002595A303|nr:aminopeptidase P family protein [uncultured Sulfitobacter sp.]
MADLGISLSGRLEAMYQLMKDAQVDAYLVLSSDAHLNEYTPEYSRRRTAITGFRGSAGDALICPEGNHIFVDSRYYLQADEEVDSTKFRVHKLGLSGEHTLSQWLTEVERERGSIRVGFDPFVVSTQAHAAYSEALRSPDSELVPIDANLVDAVWEDQPAPPSNSIYALHAAVTGSSVAEKLSNVRKEMAEAGVNLLVLTKLDEVAWVTNLRGSDIAFNPVFEAYLVIDLERATCFARTTPPREVENALNSLVEFQPYEAYVESMKQAGAKASGTVWLDPSGTTMATRLLLNAEQKIHEKPNPVVLLKAIKNDAEIAASRESHRHAAAAKIRSFKGLEDKMRSGQKVSELDYSHLLHEEYSSEDGFYDLSFTTIAAAGVNGAIVHYADANPDVLLRDGEMLLVDSGVQMLGGTTDDTRTVIVGTPTQRQKQVYTLVLRGHINLAMQRFPEGTGGIALDALARTHLWNSGLDYGHGTGHGVGAFLNVHEGPQRIAPRGADEPMKVGMIVSNEPGFYEAGWGGVRLENLYVVATDDEMPAQPDGKRWLRLDPLTLIPFDTSLIDWEQLSNAERLWLGGYHQEVWDTISPMLGDEDRQWLWQKCQLPGISISA